MPAAEPPHYKSIRDEPPAPRLGKPCSRPGTAVRPLAAVLVAVAVLAPGSGLGQPAETLVFGGDAAYPPFQWQEGRDARGFVVDLSVAVARRTSARAEYRLGDWDSAVRALRTGGVDIVAMFMSEARQRDFLFTEPFFFTSHGIFAGRDAPSVSSIADVMGSTVAVEALSYAHERMSEEGLGVTLELAPNTVEALRAVADGRAEYAIIAAIPADRLIRDEQLPLRNVGPPLWPSGYAFAVSRGRPELAERIGAALGEVFRSGEYETIESRWREALRPGDGRSPRWPAGIVAAVLGTLLAAFAVAAVLRLRRRPAGKGAGGDTRPDDAARVDHSTEERDIYVGLPRVRHFAARVGETLSGADRESVRSKKVVALKLVELDQTVRAYGHDAGIEMARFFADQLLGMGFDAYGMTGRDVFLVFGNASELEEKLRRLVSPAETLVAAAAPLPRTVAGAAACGEGCRDPRELVRRAETALGRAERMRKSWLDYRESLEPDSTDVELLNLFRKSAGQGLFPVFQPQVDVRTGEVVGAELLARWNAPGFGLVPPDRFIPLLEEAGLVGHLTRRMIVEAARVAAALRTRRLSCPISVNVAVSDLMGDRLRRTIFDALRQHELETKNLKLELTETSFADGAETIRWVMSRLRDSGLLMSIDDFGTGFSSLSYLSDFPVDEVKLDRSFVTELPARSRSRSIVRSTIAMAHELGLSVVAEGVENDATMRLLREDGCDRAQGYLIARPLPEEEFLEFVETRREQTIRTQRG